MKKKIFTGLLFSFMLSPFCHTTVQTFKGTGTGTVVNSYLIAHKIYCIPVPHKASPVQEIQQCCGNASFLCGSGFYITIY
jgi:hypothetical protein